MFFFVLSYISNAQQEYKNTTQLIQDGYAAYEKENYDDAIKFYSQINVNDENYFNAQYEISLCYYYKKNYDTAIAISKTLLNEKNNNKDLAIVYVNMGNCYSRLEKYEDAIKTAEEGLKKYPMYYLLYYNKAVYHKSNKQLQLAIDNLQKAIYYNPNDVSAHSLLGQIAADEGMLVQAMLCFNTCIFLSPEDKSTLSILQYLNTTVSKKYESLENNLVFSPKGDDFKDIEEIIRAQAALNPKYKLETDIDFPFVRQNQALFSYLQKHQGTEGFFEKYYVPFYKELYTKKYFNSYTYFMLLTSDNESIKAKVKKNMKLVADFYKWASDEYLLKCSKRKIDEIDHEVYFFYENEHLYRIGFINDQLKLEGKWIYTYNNGVPSAIGTFNDSKAVGDWKFYNMDHTLSEQKHFDNDVLNGEHITYSDNGNMKEKEFYKKDSTDGEYLSFNYFGVKTTKVDFVNNKKDGNANTYYLNGNKHVEMIYKNDLLEGKFISYYPNGAKEYEIEMKEDNKNGKFIRYYVNGQISEESQYKEGNSEGPFKLYYKNGLVKEEGTYKKNKLIGQCKSYYANGIIEEIKDLDLEGNESGLIKNYDYDGKLYCEMMKSKRKILSLKYYDKNGKIVYESKVRDNEEVELHRPDGSISEKGKTLANNKDGEWTEYYRSGIVAAKIQYKNGLLDGKSIYYYSNGEIKSNFLYRNDSLIGNYEKYYSNGQIQTKAYSYDDHEIGVTEIFTKLGSLGERYYKNDDGDITGNYEYFDDYGKVYLTQLFKEGYNYGENWIDTNGHTFYSINYKEEELKINMNSYSEFEKLNYTLKNSIVEGKFESKANNLVQTTGNYINGLKDGQWIWKSPLDSISKIYNYELGSREGIQKIYNLEGKLYLENNMMNDVYHGFFKRFYYNGSLYYESNFIDGTENGVRTTYGINGEIILQVIVDNGDDVAYITNSLNKTLSDTFKIINGNASIKGLYKSGKKGIEYDLKNGLFEGRYVVYNTDEKPIIVSNNKDGELHGEKIYYYTNGKMYMKENYLYDDNNGEVQLYRENGSLKAVATYYNDNLNGDLKIYDATGKLIEIKTYYNNQLMNVKKI